VRYCLSGEGFEVGRTLTHVRLKGRTLLSWDGPLLQVLGRPARARPVSCRTPPVAVSPMPDEGSAVTTFGSTEDGCRS
jgi:hypothetical protein